MKNIFRFIAAATAILSLGSCVKEINNGVDNEGLVRISVRGQAAELSPETRTSLADNGSLFWSFGDNISVFDGSANREFQSAIQETDDPTKSTTFDGTIQTGASSLVALYPYNESATYENGKIVTTLPIIQTAVANSFANKSNVTVSTAVVPSDNVIVEDDYALCSFVFKNVGALIKFTLSQDGVHRSITLKTKSDDIIAGEIEINPSTGVATATENGETTVTLKAASGYLAAGTYYAVILPLSEKKLSFVLSDGHSTKTRSTKEALSVERSSFIDMGTIDEGISYPDPYVGSYIIVSKAKSGTTSKWVVMKSGVDNNGRWAYDETNIASTTDINLTDSSVDFESFSDVDHKFVVETFENGHVLKDAATGLYIQHLGGANNKGKEVDAEDREAFDVVSWNEDGTWVFGAAVGEKTYSLQYNVGNYFSFYATDQAPIYLIPYVGVAQKLTLSVTCTENIVSMTASSQDAEIRYTTDGSDPTTSSTLYSEPFAITQNISIKAKAFATSSDYSDSDVVSKDCEYEDPSLHVYFVKVTSDLSDWSGDYLIVDENEGVALDGSLTTLDAAGNTIDVTVVNGKIERNNTNESSYFTIGTVTDGYSIVSASGKYIGSNSSSSNVLSTSSSYSSNFKNTLSFANNKVSIKGNVEKYLSYNASAERFRYYGSGTVSLFKLEDNRPQVNKPTISLASGEVAIGSTVVLSCTTDGATIYYTIDGSNPSSSSTAYSSAITITNALTLKAIAIKSGMRDSEIASATYTVPTCATPTISPVSGPVVSGTEVSISCETAGATIRYTLDQSEPTVSSTAYSSPLTISEPTTVKAKAFKEGCLSSETATATYTIRPNTEGEGTADDPYTVSDIVALYTNVGTTDAVYVSGFISDITEVNTNFGNATYKISDGIKEIIVYRGKYLNNAAFTSEDQIALYDNVVVFGPISIYSNAPQLATGNYLISKTSATDAPSITVSPSTSLEEPATWESGENDEKSFVVTATNGTWEITDQSSVSGWATVVINNNTIKVTPSTAQASSANSGSIVLTMTPSNSLYAEKIVSIYLSQKQYQSGGGETKTYQHVFNAKPSISNNVNLSGVNWNITATSLNGYNSANYAGVQIGSKNADGSITLTSPAAWSYEGNTTIKEVRLWLNLGGTSVTPSVTIGGKAAVSDGTTVVKNSTAGDDWTKTTKVTFTPAANGNTGVIVINVSTVKAGYICAMEIDCE